MNILKKIQSLWKSEPTTVVETYEGVVMSKHRKENRPRSYSTHMPQSILNSAYDASPDRYDYFIIKIGEESLSVPKYVWDQIHQGSKIKLTIKSVSTGNSLLSAINDLGNEEYTIEKL